MKKTFHLLFAGVSCVVFGQAYYVEVPAAGLNELKTVVHHGLDVAGVDLEKKTVTLVVHENQLWQVSPLNILNRRAIGRLDSRYKRFADVEKTLKNYEANYPNLVSLETVGKSIEGRPIYAIQITDYFFFSEKPKKVLLVDAMHHAREVMTVEIALDMIEYLIKNYETDAEVKKWLRQSTIWVVPMLNPDGNERVWGQDSMWRKNGRSPDGVDINRNYPSDWSSCPGGSSGNSFEDTYRGSGPASEPETKALVDLAARLKPHFNISYHTASEIVIYPFGCSPNRLPQSVRQKYETIGKELARKLVRDSGAGTYTAGTAYELLYNVDGGSIDTIFQQNGTFGYVIEANSTGNGFQPPYSLRDPTVKKQRAGWQYIINKMLEN